MKKALLFLFAACAFAVPSIAQQVQEGAIISFEKEIHDYGEVAYGGNGQCTFEFTNEGNTPLIISRAQGTCGCTVPSWPKEPIAPGKSAKITVKYDTKRPGSFTKKVTIYSNATNNAAKEIRITGRILPKPTSGTPVSKAGPVTK